MSKKTLCLLLCIMMCLILLPTVAFAADYDVWVGDTQVTSDNMSDVLNDGGKVSYDPVTGTLTVRAGAVITGDHNGTIIDSSSYERNLIIEATDGLTLNSTTAKTGVLSNGDLTINGNVDITVGGNEGFAIYANKNATINGNVDITVEGTNGCAINSFGSVWIKGNAEISGTSNGKAIATYGNVQVDGNLTISGNFNYGIYADPGTVTMAAGKTWDIYATNAAIVGHSIELNGNEITFPADGMINTIEGCEVITKSDGTTVATHVIIKAPVVPYGITINGVAITSANAADVFAGTENAGKVSYDASRDVLTINGTMTDTSADLNRCAVTIEGNGTCDVEMNGGSSWAANGDLNISNVKNVSVSTEFDGPALFGADITCTDNVTVNNPNGSVCYNAFTVTSAKDVTLNGKSNSLPLLMGDVAITCSGKVDMVNEGAAPISTLPRHLKIEGATDVTITGNTEMSLVNDMNISCRGDVTITNSKGNICYNTPTITGATDVTMKGKADSLPLLMGDASITCTGNVILVNEGAAPISTLPSGGSAGRSLTIQGAKNVTITGNHAATLVNRINISCSGDVSMTNSNGGICFNAPTITDARNVTMTGNTNSLPLLFGNPTIECSGDVLLQNEGTEKAVSGTLNFKRPVAGGKYYSVKTGDAIDSLTTQVIKPDSEIYSGTSDDAVIQIKECGTPYTVTFNMKGHGTAPDAQTVGNGDTATRPEDPTESGYTFGGWYADEELTIEFNFATPITGNKTVYAKWTKSYTVTFNMKGHGTQVNELTVTEGNTATRPEDPTASGYAFGGWYADEELTTEFDFTAPITENKTVYAKWTETYTVTFDMKGHGTQVDAQTVTEGTTAIRPENPTASGYTFGGWYADESLTTEFNFATPITADITLYAKWTKKSSGGGGGGGSYVSSTTTVTTPKLKMEMQIDNKDYKVNGKTYTYDVAPFIVGDRTMVPVRVIMETLGAKVDWNEAARSVTITLDGKVMTMTIGKEIPGYGSAPVIQNDRTYVPIRYIMENTGAKVEWIAKTGEIIITK